MKNSFSTPQPVKILLFFALSLLLAAPAIATQAVYSAQAETRYIDRSKGERNKAYPVREYKTADSQTQSGNTDGPLLWRIEHPNTVAGDIRSSYIFGTIHIDDKRVMAIPGSITRRLSSVDTLMLELELNANGSVDILRKMLFTDGRSLPQVIGEEPFNRVTEALLDTGNQLSIEVLSVLKPWAAMLLLIRPVNNSGTFLDKKLATLARNAKVRVQGLETVDEQLSVFDDIPIADQIGLLNSALESLAEKDQAYQQLIDAYLSGNLENLVQVSASQQPKDDRLARLIRQKLISERNQKMFERMQMRLQAGNTFIAVGALHLPGEQGLLQQLQQAGYRLTRIAETE